MNLEKKQLMHQLSKKAKKCFSADSDTALAYTCSLPLKVTRSIPHFSTSSVKELTDTDTVLPNI